MKKILEMLVGFEKEMNANSAVIIEKFELNNTPVDPSVLQIQHELKRIEPTVLQYFEVANGIDIKWKASDPAMQNNEMTGSVKVNSFSQVVKDWSGVVFFDHHPSESPIRKFFPLDFFVDEAAVGYCTKEGWRDMMYLYQFEGDLIPLYVNFQSYLQLMVHARACLYWQYLLLELIEKEENTVSQRIKQYLPQLFPAFSFSEFESLFNGLRIN